MTVAGMARKHKVHGAAAQPIQLLRLGHNVHSLRHSGGAAGHRLGAVDLHHAELAAALGLQIRMGTDMGNVDPRIQRGIQDALALFSLDLDVIDPKCYLSHDILTSQFLFSSRAPERPPAPPASVMENGQIHIRPYNYGYII